MVYKFFICLLGEIILELRDLFGFFLCLCLFVCFSVLFLL